MDLGQTIEYKAEGMKRLCLKFKKPTQIIKIVWAYALGMKNQRMKCTREANQ